MASYSVIEDKAGSLTLYVFADVTREVCIYARGGYESIPGQLSQDIVALRAGLDPVAAWDGGDEDSQASWNALTEEGRRYGEWTIIADEDGIIPAEQMGVMGRREFYGDALSSSAA